MTEAKRRRRGRPEKRFIDDPDRFAVALAAALLKLGEGERKAFGFAAAVSSPQRVEHSLVDRQGSEMHCASVWLASTADSRTRTLRAKMIQAEKSDPLVRGWLGDMSTAFAYVLSGRPTDGFRFMSAVGESGAAAAFLAPALRVLLGPRV